MKNYPKEIYVQLVESPLGCNMRKFDTACDFEGAVKYVRDDGAETQSPAPADGLLGDVLARYPQGGAIPCTADLGTFMIPSGDFLTLLNFARNRAQPQVARQKQIVISDLLYKIECGAEHILQVMNDDEFELLKSLVSSPQVAGGNVTLLRKALSEATSILECAGYLVQAAEYKEILEDTE